MDTTGSVRRYLTNFDSARMGHVLTDTLIVGGGVAGLSAARAAAKSGDAILITKGRIDESATFWAQGGVASVHAAQDSVEQHVADTLAVGAGLNRTDAVELICNQGPRRIAELIAEGLPFDRSNGDIALGLEGGHSQHRVLHAGGDATGRALGEFLVHKVRGLHTVRIFEQCFLIDLLIDDGVCVGAVTFHPKYGHQLIWSRSTILASGGFGQLFRETTNPPPITGDGVAAAFRAGAVVADMELMQFHPTTLYIAGSSRALISEAVRGEGAHLVDKAGYRFMLDVHPDGELAPRDVVSRAIVSHMGKTRATSVYLDVRHIGRSHFAERFPTIMQRLSQFGIDPAKDLIPVRPAAHFAIGGVVTDLSAATSVPGLYACGEAACCGLHGANRLASNSLLEGLVMGRIATEHATSQSSSKTSVQPRRMRQAADSSDRTLLDLDDIRHSLQSVMWRNAGIQRNGDRLSESIEIIDFWCRFVLDKTFDQPGGWEVQNMLILAGLVSKAALIRAESRGVHFRSDCDAVESPKYAGHIAFQQVDQRISQYSTDLSFQASK